MKIGNNKNAIIGILIAVIVLMAVGYAALAQTLNINGVSNITSHWEILFTDMNFVENKTGKNVSSSYDATTATFDVELQSPGDYVEYTLTVENRGTFDALLSSVIKTNLPSTGAIIYTLSGADEGDILFRSQSKEVVVKIMYNPNITTQPSINDLNQSITITLNYIQNMYEGSPNIPVLPALAFTTTATTNSITVTVDPSSINPLLGSIASASNIDSYQFSKDGGKTFTPAQKETTYTFTNLEEGRSYDIKVRGLRGKTVVGDSEVEKVETFTILNYTNGEIVYFNPETGKRCNDYVESNSDTENKSGCMEWYVFLSTTGINVNLILAHNTTAAYRWSYTDRNDNNLYTGNLPQGVGKQGNAVWTRLQNDTTTWHTSIRPSIRLITVWEVAQITGHLNFNLSSPLFYLQTNNTTPSPTCQSETGGNITNCTFGWLYDRTRNDCLLRGCTNNAVGTNTWGYWTSSPHGSETTRAWSVRNNGSSGSNGVGGVIGDSGIRPVITIPKSLLH